MSEKRRRKLNNSPSGDRRPQQKRQPNPRSSARTAANRASHTSGRKSTVNTNLAERQARIANFSPEEYERYITSGKRVNHSKHHSKSKSQPKRNPEHQVRDQELRDKKAHNEKRRHKRSIFTLSLALAIIVVSALVICAFVFFKVSTVSVTGNSKYSEEQIVEASLISQGDNLFMFGRTAASKSIMSKCPYVVSVKYRPGLSGKVTIVVEETTAAFCFPIEDDSENKVYILTSYDGKVLEKADEKSEKSVTVTGMAVTSAQIGDKIVLEGEKAMDNLTSLLKTAKNSGLEKITGISVSSGAYTVVYDGRYSVEIGAANDLEYKLSLAWETVKKLDEENPSQSGTIDVSDADKTKSAYFSAG